MARVDPAQLARTAVFGGLSDEELGQVAERLGEQRFASGDWVVQQGEPAREMFVIREGSVEVWLAAGDRRQRLTTLGPHDCFGEMALIDVQPRSAGVRACEPTTVWTLSGADLRGILKWRPATYALVVGNIAREISRRLRRRDAAAAEFRLDGDA